MVKLIILDGNPGPASLRFIRQLNRYSDMISRADGCRMAQIKDLKAKYYLWPFKKEVPHKVGTYPSWIVS